MPGEAVGGSAQEQAEAADIGLAVECRAAGTWPQATTAICGKERCIRPTRRCVDLQRHLRAGGEQVGQHGGEQDDIADALLAPDEDAAAVERIALPQRQAVAAAQGGVVAQPPAPFELRPAFRPFLRQQQSAAQIVVRHGMRRIARDGRAVARDRRGEVAAVAQQVAKVDMRVGEAGIRRQHRPVFPLGGLAVALVGEHRGEIAARLDQRRLDREGAPIAGLGGIPLLQRLVRRAEIDLERSIARQLAGGEAQHLDGLGISPP